VGNGFMIGDTTIDIFCYVINVDWLQILLLLLIIKDTSKWLPHCCTVSWVADRSTWVIFQRL